MSMTTVPQLSPDEFQRLVDEDIRTPPDGRPPAGAEFLRRPENVERWYHSLVAIKKSVEGQLGARKADMRRQNAEALANGYDISTERARYERWRASSLRFKSGVELKLSEATALRSQSHAVVRATLLEDERNEAAETLRALLATLKRHRAITTSEFEDVSEIEEELWSFLPDDHRAAS